MLKKIAIVLILILTLFQGAYFMPRAYSQTYTDTDKAFAFLSNVIQLDLTQYQPVVLNTGPINMGSLGPSTEVQIQLEPDIPLRPPVTMTGFRCTLYFSNGTPYSFSMSGGNMTMHYSQAQPSTALDVSKEMLQRYQTYLAQYCGVDGSYLQPMLTMLNNVTEPISTVQVLGNVQMKIDYSSGMQQISGVEKALVTKTNIAWTYTYNGINVNRIHISLDFPNGTLSHFMDTWNLLAVGSWNMISQQEAISMAFSAAQNFTFELVNSSGQTYEVKPELSDSASASLLIEPRNGTELYPFWEIEIFFTKSYGDVVGIQVGIWADTKEIVSVHEYGYLGPSPPYDTTTSTQPTATPTVPELSWLVIATLLLSVFSVAVVVRHQKTAKPK